MLLIEHKKSNGDGSFWILWINCACKERGRKALNAFLPLLVFQVMEWIPMLLPSQSWNLAVKPYS